MKNNQNYIPNMMINDYQSNDFPLQDNLVDKPKGKQKVNKKIEEFAVQEDRNIETAFAIINDIIRKKDNQLKFLETIIQKKDEEINSLKAELILLKGKMGININSMNEKHLKSIDDNNYTNELKEGNDTDYSMDDINHIKMKLNKRKTSNNNSSEHIKIMNNNYKDAKANSHLINSLKSVESGKPSPSPQERYNNNYNDYNNYNAAENNKNSAFNYYDTNSSNVNNRNKVREFLNEVKEKLDSKRFKVFIKNVKILTDKNQNVNRKQVFDQVKDIFGDEHIDLYIKFENILSPNNNVKFS